jgi:hypothetical protein
MATLFIPWVPLAITASTTSESTASALGASRLHGTPAVRDGFGNAATETATLTSQPQVQIKEDHATTTRT